MREIVAASNEKAPLAFGRFLSMEHFLKHRAFSYLLEESRMGKTWRRLLAFSVIAVLLAGSAGSISASLGNSVSIVQLIATPEKYDGKVVQVMGFLRLEFEGNAIYLHEDDYTHAIYKNGLMIVINSNIEPRADKLNLHTSYSKGLSMAKTSETRASTPGPLPM
jgi:hypothetical protein